MKLSIKDKKTFDETGCVIVPNVITRKKAKEIRDKVESLAESEKKHGDSYYYPFDKKGKTQRVWNLLNKDKVFRDLIETEIVDEFMNYIFERDTTHQKYYLSSFQANILNPGAEKQRLHIDTPVPEPLPLWPIKANSIWLLEDFTDINGATEYLAGSHKFSFKPNEEHDKSTPLKKACGEAGSVLFTHGALWHRAGANESLNPRIALLCSFAASYAREIANEEDHSKVISDDVIENASPHLKKILGHGHGLKAGAFFDHTSISD